MWKVLLLIALIFPHFALAQQSPSVPIGLDALIQLDRLPLLRNGVWFHCIGSQDVTGGNEDGFTHSYSSQYSENGRYVLVDTRGPACVQMYLSCRYNVFTHKTEFDGDLSIETQQNGKQKIDVIPYGDLYSYKRPPFLSPLIRSEQDGGGSAFSFVPICSENGIKISTDKGGDLLFYEMFYHTFAPGTPVKAFDPAMDVSAALDRWKAIGEPLDRRPSAANARKVDLSPKSAVPVWSSSGAGTVTAIRLKLGKVSDDVLRHVRIKAYWDGELEPSVDTPLGPFFGTGYWVAPDPPGTPKRYGHASTSTQEVAWFGKGAVELGRMATRSLPVGADNNSFYNFFPMPFFRSGRIELENDSNLQVPDVEVTVSTVAGPPTPSSAYFHAKWREENPALPYHDFTALDTRGHGHYVGTVLVQSSVHYDPAKRGEIQRWHLEGDARFYIDDNRTPYTASTGTEDYYMGGWYDLWSMDKIFSLASNGYPVHDIDSQDHSVNYRFHLGDLVPYYRSFRFTMEHGPDGNLPANYSGTAFYYQVDAPSLTMTDQLTLTDAESERSHAYSPEKVAWQGCRDLPFEGDRQIVFTNAYKADLKNGTQEKLFEALHACGQRVQGNLSFTVSTLPDNRGLKLRRMLDYAPPDIPGQEIALRSKPLIAPAETAHVFVDGKDAGEWHLSPRHARLAWLEEDFEIPAALTGGKKQVNVRLEVAPGSSWSAFQYRVYCYR